jgi:tetratricopeptide (TPR) repeat protein
MRIVVALILAGLPQLRPPAPAQVSAVIREAGAALEGDSAARVRARWQARLRRSPNDRIARLGITQLDYLLGDFRLAIAAGRTVAGSFGDATAAHAWLVVALSEGALGRPARADSAFVRASALARAGNDSSLLGSTLVLQALAQVSAAGGSKSDSLLEHARRWIPSRDSLLLAGHLCTGAAVGVARGRGRARPAADSGMAIALRHGDRRLAARCQLLVAQDQLRSGRLDLATRAFDAIAAAQRAVHDRAGLTITLQLAGTLANIRGEYAAAARAFREAAEAGVVVDNAGALSATALSAIALQYGRVDEARTHATRALGMFRTQGNEVLVSATLGQLGNIARASGNTRAAQRYYEELLAPATAAKNAVALFALRSSLFDVALMDRDLARAARELAQVRAEMPPTAEVRDVVGGFDVLLNLRRGRLDEAERALKGITTAPQPARAWFLGALAAELHARRGRLDSAASRLAHAMDDVDAWRASLNDRQLRQTLLEPRLLYADPDLGVATVIERLAAGGRASEALVLAERLRARELLDRLERNAALGDRPRAQAVPLVGGRTGRMRSLPRILPADLIATLPDETTALLEFVTGSGGEPTTLFVVSRDGIRSHRLESIDSVAAQASLFTRLATAGVSSPATARALGARLFGAALAGLPAGVTRLVLVPGRGLHQVPFDALALRDGTLLGERFDLSVMPSITVARTVWALPSRGPGTMLTFGDPAPPSRTTLRRHPLSPTDWADGLPPLPGAGREARGVGALFSGSVVLTGAEASEAVLKTRSMAGVSILHLATHAWVDEANLGGSVLALAPGDAEDGLVLADDLASLQLDADLVTLSACATARGVDLQAEGLVGLTVPLLEAGARAVLATAWRVDDAQTARFMAGFYRELANGRNVGEALQRTKAAARRRGAAVSVWGAFTLVGDATIRPQLRAVR